MITKHPGTGGLVSVDTVTAQLLYEITGARYANPDVTARMDTIELSDDGGGLAGGKFANDLGQLGGMHSREPVLFDGEADLRRINLSDRRD